MMIPSKSSLCYLTLYIGAGRLALISHQGGSSYIAGDLKSAELTPGIIGYQDSISKASAKMPLIELRTDDKLQQDGLERFHPDIEAKKRLLALLDNENKEIGDKISTIRSRGDLILICNHLEELHQLLKLKLHKKPQEIVDSRQLGI
ncbi:hypothetical protein PGT21_032336 [Puccinia graminis f. sp. tritici]|uniref:Uncharacterized protein n=1 Tax=Puccinia graminis f. sp. tritici TaxID=56615 RepID=A0A5B0PKZ3_PUCGR|nr:hypothetical protein PGT21_032336 [Puccinia graminis f. sp. tritici]